MENQPRAQEVRRLLGRPLERLRPPRALDATSAVVTNFIRRACGRASHVFVYNYGVRTAEAWWQAQRNTLERQSNLTVFNIPMAASAALAKLADRNMEVQCTIQEGQIWLTDGKTTVHVEPNVLKQHALAES